MNSLEYDTYLETLDEIESRISDDSKFPVIEDGRIKMICKLIFEFIKMILNYLKYHIVDATKKES
jgi:hypothetical protein